MEVELVPDTILETLAKMEGPSSIEGQVWRYLREQRARDRQIFAFRVGAYWLTAPFPDARTEARLIALAQLDEDAEGDIPAQASLCRIGSLLPTVRHSPRQRGHGRVGLLSSVSIAHDDGNTQRMQSTDSELSVSVVEMLPDNRARDGEDLQ
jgi:hypothetical protein